MKKVLFIFYCVLSIPAIAQQSNYAGADSTAFALKNRPFPSIAALVNQLTAGLKSDTLKVRAIYSWVTESIQYDMKAFIDKTYTNGKSPLMTLTDRKGVCQDFSELVKEMCQLANIQCEVIPGLAKPGPLLGTGLHAWNAVLLNNKWYLLNASWGSLQLAVNKYDYFLSPPEQFICNHFPDIPKWSLLEKTPDKQVFLKYPYVSADFFKVAGPDFPKELNLVAHNQTLTVRNFAAATGKSLFPIVLDDQNMNRLGNHEYYTPIDIGVREITNAEKKIVQYQLTGIPKGKYWLYLYAVSDEGDASDTTPASFIPANILIFKVESL